MQKTSYGLPGTVTIKIPAEKLNSIKSGVMFEIPLPHEKGLQYDFSTLRLLCGLKPSKVLTEFIMSEDLSLGIQLVINTVPCNPDIISDHIILKVFKEFS